MSDLAQPRGPDSVDVFGATRGVCEWQSVDLETFNEDISAAHQPAVLRAQNSSWPAVRAAQTSNEALLEYLSRFDTGARAELFVGTAEMDGRFFYDDQVSTFNFSKAQAPLPSSWRT